MLSGCSFGFMWQRTLDYHGFAYDVFALFAAYNVLQSEIQMYRGDVTYKHAFANPALTSENETYNITDIDLIGLDWSIDAKIPSSTQSS